MLIRAKQRSMTSASAAEAIAVVGWIERSSHTQSVTPASRYRNRGLRFPDSRCAESCF